MTFWQFEELYIDTMPRFIGRWIKKGFIGIGYLFMVPFVTIGVIFATVAIGYISAYRATYIWWLSGPK